MTTGYAGNKVISPYFVNLRQQERLMVQDALAEFGDDIRAAAVLGVSRAYLRDRARVIGGFLGEPVHEPPTGYVRATVSIAKARQALNAKRNRDAVRAAAKAKGEDDAP